MNFGAIQGYVAQWLDRDDLTPIIPVWINLLLRKLERQYNFKYMFDSSEEVLSSNTVDVPTRYKALEYAFVQAVNKRYPLMHLTYRDAMRMYPSIDGTGIPKLIVNNDNSEFLLLPAPSSDSSYTLELGYYIYSTSLSLSDDTNWMTENASDVLIYGSLLQSAPYLIEDQRLETWKVLYDDAFTTLLLSENREKVSGSPIIIQPYGDVV